ncbi:hypothetical protein KHM19_01150 [Leptospira borgpetersenii]|nr:hypothetical protein KHM19_01150 [Leptospira borgpetersenii]GIM24287.1 hypothetical protein KHM25_02120 [Leptospira borgpetersenii]
MQAFAEGKIGINVGASAFLQAHPIVLEKFISKGPVFFRSSKIFSHTYRAPKGQRDHRLIRQ